MLTDPAPVIRPYLPGDQDADDFLLRMDLDACLDRFVLDRERLVARLETLSPTEWTQTAEHGEYRTYSVFIMGQYSLRERPAEALRTRAEVIGRSIPWPTPKKSPNGASTLGTVLPSK